MVQPQGKAEKIPLEKIVLEYRKRCLASGQAFLPTEKKLVFALFFMVAFWGSLELLAHLSLKPLSDPYAHLQLEQKWRLSPNQEGQFLEASYHIDSSGFRQTLPVPKEAPSANRFRIVCIGDSVCFGDGVEDKDTLASQLTQQVLAKMPEAQVEVINAGVPGVQPEQWKPYLKSLLEPKPDLLVCFWGSEVLLKLSRTFNPDKIPDHSLFHHSALVEQLKRGKMGLRTWRDQEWEFGMKVLKERAEKPFHPRVFEKILESYAGMMQFAKKKKIPLIIGEIPSSFEIPETEAIAKKWAPLYHYSDWSFANWKHLFAQLNQELEALCLAESQTWVSWKDVLQDPQNFKDFRHPSALGIQSMSKVLEKVVEQEMKKK